MDIVSTAASLTALIAIAIHSTKVIYQTVQHISDGPYHVQRLATKAEALRHTLQQLATLITDQARHDQWQQSNRSFDESPKDGSSVR